jgi:protoheme IX farnesyltransferase
MSKFKLYWQLIKSLQTFLLLITGIAGYLTAKCPYLHPGEFTGLVISLFLTISGTTVLNMIWDRHIDAKMERTKYRPIPAGKITLRDAYIFGISILVIGLIIGFILNPLYAAVLFAGFFFDYVVYTIWLKQRTAWSIVWGGISGGMPILAGRVLAVGRIDLIGILLALGILFWIPTHIMTFNIRFYDDYQKAGIPTFPHTIGIKRSRLIIALSSIISALSFTFVAYILGLEWGFLRILIILGSGLIILALVFIFKPTDKLNFHLFKAASLYMLFAMIVISIASIVQRGGFG